VTQPSTSAQVGMPFRRQPVIQVRDAAGNPIQVPGVTVTAGVATGSGSLIGTRTRMTGPDGRATFTDLGITGGVETHTLIFAAAGLASVTSSGTDVNPAATTTRIVSDEPDQSAPGQPVTVVYEVTSESSTPLSGTVQVTTSGGSESCSASAAEGQCVITLTAEGNRILTATFQGSTLFGGSSDTEPHSVVTPDTPPTAVDDGYSATAGVELSVPQEQGVLANDSDVDGDQMTAAVLDGPDHGSLTLNPNGSFQYLPDATFFGQDVFTYTVTAGGASDTGTVTIIVAGP
jgi:hypothetical protein